MYLIWVFELCLLFLNSYIYSIHYLLFLNSCIYSIHVFLNIMYLLFLTIKLFCFYLLLFQDMSFAISIL